MTAKEAFATALDELGFVYDEDSRVTPETPKGVTPTPPKGSLSKDGQNGNEWKPMVEKSLAQRLHEHQGKCEAKPGNCPLEKELKESLEEQGLNPEEAAKEAKDIHDGKQKEGSFAKVDGQLPEPETVEIGGKDLSVMTEGSKDAAEKIRERLEHPKTPEQKKVAEEVLSELANNPATNGMVQPGDITPEEAKNLLGDAAKATQAIQAQAAQANGGPTADPIAAAHAAAAEMRSPAGQLSALRSEYDASMQAWNQKWSQASAN